jgi:hypothetical protein
MIISVPFAEKNVIQPRSIARIRVHFQLRLAIHLRGKT